MSDLQEAIALFKAGKKAEARAILMPFLKTHRDNEKAWVYMAACAANRKELEISVRNVLRLNPENKVALRLVQEHTIVLPVTQNLAAPENKPQEIFNFADEGAGPTELSRPTELQRPEELEKLLQKRQAASKQTVRSSRRGQESESQSRIALGLGLVMVAATILAILGLVAYVLSEDDELSASAVAATQQSATQLANEALNITNENMTGEALVIQDATAIALTLTGASDTGLPTIGIETLITTSINPDEAGEFAPKDAFATDETVQVVVNMLPHSAPVTLEISLSGENVDSPSVLPVNQTTLGNGETERLIAQFAPPENWQPGIYSIDVRVNNQVLGSAVFSVE